MSLEVNVFGSNLCLCIVSFSVEDVGMFNKITVEQGNYTWQIV